MAVFMDLKGTSQTSFQLGKGGPKIRDNSGVIEARNAANSAYVDFVAEILRANGNSIVINNDSTGSGADWKITLARPTSGMTADVTLTLPPDDGTAGQFLQTDGAGNLIWATASSPSVTEKITVDTTTLNFGDSSPVAMFTLPANAVVHKVEVIIDTSFDTAATVQVGKVGNLAKYMDTADQDLQGAAQDSYSAQKNNPAFGSSEALIATYVSASATVGSARILTHYSIPA
jgi:hypothetical protein